MQERRRHDRHRAFQAGTIAHRGCRVPMDCVVRDVSAGGALLLLDEPQRAPSEMDLRFARGGDVCRARIVWRGETGVGVAFTPAVPHEARSEACSVVSIAEERARRSAVHPDRFADRLARVSRPAPRERPA